MTSCALLKLSFILAVLLKMFLMPIESCLIMVARDGALERAILSTAAPYFEE